MQNQKNYIGFVNDHSGSMNGAFTERQLLTIMQTSMLQRLRSTREMLDTVVSVVGVGFPEVVM